MLASSSVSTNDIRLRASMSCRSDRALAGVYRNACAFRSAILEFLETMFRGRLPAGLDPSGRQPRINLRGVSIRTVHSGFAKGYVVYVEA